MFRNFVLLFATVLWSFMTLPLQKEASAETALTRAVVQNLRNLVRLIPQDRKARPARVSDAMSPGDTLSTGRSSLAELRFNDGSLARIGERAVFRFLAKTRNFKLSNGTILLLIPPGRGITGVQTPNATAAIRGSALFIRYIPDTDTTIVGALTDSKIEVFNQGTSQSKVLEAGQMAVVVKDRIERLYDFDLNTFYETSDMVQELDLNQQDRAVSSDPAIALVQSETAAAAAAQPPITGEGVIENPAFVQPPASSSGETPSNQGNPSTPPPNAAPSGGGPPSVGTPSGGSGNDNSSAQPSGNVNSSAQPSGNDSSTPETPAVENSSPETPAVENSSPETPAVENSSPETPPVENSSPETPPVDSSTTDIFPVDSSTTDIFPVDSSTTDIFPVENSAPEIPPVDSSTPETPPVENSAPETPPVENSTPETPPVENSAPETPPVENSAPEIPPVENSAPETPPVDSSAPETPPVENSTPDIP